jgi:type VI secretion system protein ImpK
MTQQQAHDLLKKNESQGDSIETNFVAATLLRQVTLVRAQELARAGHYAEAEILLSEMRREDQAAPAMFDLLARIRAQQGRLLEAEALWTQAAQLDPANDTYQAGLQRIARMQSHPIWFASLWPLIIGLAVVTSVGIAAFAVRSSISELRDSLRSELAQMAAPQKPIAPVQDEQPPDVKLNIPGVSLKTERNEIVLTFDSGLFIRGIEFTSEAKLVLAMLGRQLEPYVGHISVHVIGHTDDLPIMARHAYRDNIALGFNRALAVVEHLRATSRLPSAVFSISSLGEYLTPYANDTPENRARNRTVVLRIFDAGT